MILKFTSSNWLGLFTAILAWVTVSAPQPVAAQSEQKYYVWMDDFSQQANGESFVVEVDATAKAQIDQIRAGGGIAGMVMHITSGSVPYNKDYRAPGQPVWNWHVVGVQEVFDRATAFRPTGYIPNYDDKPSVIAADPVAWINNNGDTYIAWANYAREEVIRIKGMRWRTFPIVVSRELARERSSQA